VIKTFCFPAEANLALVASADASSASFPLEVRNDRQDIGRYDEYGRWINLDDGTV
jgi:hypothetical protein